MRVAPRVLCVDAGKDLTVLKTVTTIQDGEILPRAVRAVFLFDGTPRTRVLVILESVQRLSCQLHVLLTPSSD